jgi:hypothetical protein
MNTKIIARLLAMSQDEMMGMVCPRTIRDIKLTDPTPKLLALVVGHEGDATPNKVGIGQVLTRWYRSAIEAMTSKLALGTFAYHGHAGTNSEKNRAPVGEVIGKLTKKIGDVISSIIVAYIYPQFRDLPFDVASIEATVSVPPDSKSFDVQDVDVQAITGIALGNSRIDTPAFPGATLLAQLQAFAGNQRTAGGGEMNLTLDEVKAAILEGKWKPSEVFEPKVLAEDPFIVGHVKEEKGNEYYARKRNQVEFDEKIKTLEAEKKTLQDQIQGQAQAALKVKARESFDAVLAERPKLKEDERFSKFIRKQFDKSFTPTEEAKLKDDLNKFVDGQVGEFTELFGEPGKPGDKGGKPEGKTQTAAGGNGSGRADAGAADSLLNPKNNELIPQD